MFLLLTAPVHFHHLIVFDIALYQEITLEAVKLHHTKGTVNVEIYETLHPE